MKEFKVTLEGKVSKIEEDEKQRIAYVRLTQPGKVATRFFEVLSGGPTLGVAVPLGQCRVGDSVTIDVAIRSVS
jgi:hypothetical protein